MCVIYTLSNKVNVSKENVTKFSFYYAFILLWFLLFHRIPPYFRPFGDFNEQK